MFDPGDIVLCEERRVDELLPNTYIIGKVFNYNSSSILYTVEPYYFYRQFMRDPTEEWAFMEENEMYHFSIHQRLL